MKYAIMYVIMLFGVYLILASLIGGLWASVVVLWITTMQLIHYNITTRRAIKARDKEYEFLKRIAEAERARHQNGGFKNRV